jgi:hypothetical protein
MRTGPLIAMVAVVVLALAFLLVGRVVLKKAGAAKAVNVSSVLDGTISAGTVTVKGIVDDIDHEGGAVFLKDLEKEEVCRGTTCVLAVIKVVTSQRVEIGQKVEMRGRIAYQDNLPYIVAE